MASIYGVSLSLLLLATYFEEAFSLFYNNNLYSYQSPSIHEQQAYSNKSSGIIAAYIQDNMSEIKIFKSDEKKNDTKNNVISFRRKNINLNHYSESDLDTNNSVGQESFYDTGNSKNFGSNYSKATNPRQSYDTITSQDKDQNSESTQEANLNTNESTGTSNKPVEKVNQSQPAVTTSSDDLPFETLVSNEPVTTFTCPDVITPHMHTEYNFNLLSQMGCNPTFSYN